MLYKCLLSVLHMKPTVWYYMRLTTKVSVFLFSWSSIGVCYPLLEGKITFCLESKLKMCPHFTVSCNILCHTIKTPPGKSNSSYYSIMPSPVSQRFTDFPLLGCELPEPYTIYLFVPITLSLIKTFI